MRLCVPAWMKEPPNSGTTPRQEAREWFDLGRLPFKLAGLPIGATVGRLIDSETLMAVMLRQNPGMTREAAAAIIRTLTPAAAPAAVQEVNAYRAATAVPRQTRNAFADVAVPR